MKTFKIFTAILFLVATIVSCNKDQIDKQFLTSSDGTIVVPGANNGGNITCEEVASVTGCTFDYSVKKDYYGGSGGTVGPITWWTDGIYVTWVSSVPLKIAVIVKGGPNANVYFTNCQDCKTSNGSVRLTAPVNPRNGKPYGLSNITFCYSLCSDLVFGLKSYMQKDKSTWVTTGSFITSYPLALGASYKLYQECWNDSDLDPSKEVGYLKITDIDSDGYWEITVDNTLKPALQFSLPFLYVGSAAAFTESFNSYPYPNPRNQIDPPVNTWTFELPFLIP